VITSSVVGNFIACILISCRLIVNSADEHRFAVQLMLLSSEKMQNSDQEVSVLLQIVEVCRWDSVAPWSNLPCLRAISSRVHLMLLLDRVQWFVLCVLHLNCKFMLNVSLILQPLIIPNTCSIWVSDLWTKLASTDPG